MRIRAPGAEFWQTADSRQFSAGNAAIRPGMSATAPAQAKSRNIGACFRMNDTIAERMWL